LCVKGEYSLNGDIDPSEPIILKHDLTHPLSIRLRVHRRFRQKHLHPFRIDFELLVESVVPEMSHVGPVLDDAVFHRLGHLEVGTVLGGFVADHQVTDGGRAEALFGSQDRTTDNGGEDWGMLASA